MRSRRRGLWTGVLAAALAAAVLTAVPAGPAAGPATPVAQEAPAALSIPDTAFAVPSGAVFLSTTGSDAGTGSVVAPYRTLGRALSAVGDGGTVVVRGGTYRDGVATSTSAHLTLQPYPHEQVWFDGTDVVTGWSPAGEGVWSRTGWSTPAFCGGHYYDLPYGQQSSAGTGPCAHQDMAGDAAHPAAGDPQMLFLDGTAVPETSDPAHLAGHFSYDQGTRTVRLGLDPTGHRVEMAARPTALLLQGGSGATVRGIGFRRYATNEYNGNATHGAVLAGEPNLVFEDDVFTEQAGAGLSFTDPRGGVVRSSVFSRNGFNGLDANGHQHTTGATDGFSILDSTFTGNNTERFGSSCSASCAAAGSKITHMVGITVKGSVFEGTRGGGKGLWCDLACSRATIVDNTFSGNGNAGLCYEVSDSALIASNLITGNRGYGLKVSAADTRIINNTIAGNGDAAVLVYDDDRSPGVGGWTDVGPDTARVSLLNNIVSGGSVSFWRTSATAPNTGPDTFVTGMDSDSYHRSARGTLVDWRDGPTTSYTGVAALHSARGLEAHGQDTVGVEEPFVDAAAGDYRVLGTSAAHASGTPLPADVAAAIGVAPGTALDRGALVRPARSARVPATRARRPAPAHPVPGGHAKARRTPRAASITSTSPAADGTLRGTVRLTARARGSTSARLYLGSVLADTFTGPGPYRFDLASGRLADGMRLRTTWRVTGADGATASRRSTLTVRNGSSDRAPPVVRIDAPSADAVLSGRVQLRASTTDGTAVTGARLCLGSSLAQTWSGPGPYAFGLDSTRLAPGTRVHITWRVSDDAGGTSQAEQHVTVGR